MAVGRISGPLLKSNLLRNGVDLAFETDLLYLDVNNQRIGVKTKTPSHDLQVVGTTRTTDLIVDTQADIGDITIAGTTIESSSNITLTTAIGDSVVINGRVEVNDIVFNNNEISTIGTNTDLKITPNGDGIIRVIVDTVLDQNLTVTGTVEIDDNVVLGIDNTKTTTFNSKVSSNLVPSQDNTYSLGTEDLRWNNVWVNTLSAGVIDTDDLVVDGVDLALRQGNTYFVSVNGDDTKTGTHLNDPFKTVKRALELATAGDTVHIFPGVYEEQFPLTLSVGVTVKGQGIRSVFIKPTEATKFQDAFLLNGETTIEDLTIGNFFYNSSFNTGYAFKYANNLTVTNRSPYIRNITVITEGSNKTTTDPRGFLSGDAGRGAYFDGSLATAQSKEASGLFHSVTFITPGVDAVILTNGVRVEWLNCFTYFANRSIYAIDGASGLKGQGQTQIRVTDVTGSYQSGETIEYYDFDGTTVLATATIESVASDGKIFLNGKILGFELPTQRQGKLVQAFGNAKLSTSVRKFGTASLSLDGINSYAFVQSNADFGYGVGDFTIEFWIYRVGTGIVQIIYDQRTSSATTYSPVIFLNSSNQIAYTDGEGVTKITGSTTVPLNAWSHIALSRSGTETKLFLNGIQQGITYTDANSYIATPVRVGSRWNNTGYFSGFVDDVRILKGVAAYTENFTPPVSQLPSTQNTVLLLRFDGTNESTDFVDSTVYDQDIRFSSGATAKKFTLIDYTDFGAEVRLIASASIYGNFGLVGDGPGVIMYAIGHNVAYIGSGKDSDNDPVNVVQNQEIVQLNQAKIYYSTVDHKGDYRVGELFYVNQQDGSVQFTGADFNIDTSQGITLTDGINTTFIDGSQIQTGNWKISGNTIETLSGNANFTAASDEIYLNNNVTVSGDLSVVGNVTITGNIQIGDEVTDTIEIVARVGSDIIPETNETYSIGSTNLRWNTVWAGEIRSDSIRIDNNVIETVDADTDLILKADGTGIILVPSNNVVIDQNLTVQGNTTLDAALIIGNITHTGNVTQTGDFDIVGNVDITGTLTVSSLAQFEDIKIDANLITTTEESSDLVIRATIGNIISIPENDVDITQNLTVEGTIFADGITVDTSVTANSFSTGDILINDNVVETKTANSNLILRADGTGIVSIPNNNLIIDQNLTVNGTTDLKNVDIQGNIIQTGDITQTGDINLTGSVSLTGTVSVSSFAQFEDIKIDKNVITTTVTNTDLRLTANGTGIVSIPNNSVVLDKDLTVNGNTNLQNLTSISVVAANEFFTGNIRISDNFIRTTLPNTNLIIEANNEGSVRVEGINVKNNTISPTTAQDLLIETSAGQSIKFQSTESVTIPKGTTAQRPAPAEAGMLRFNTTTNEYEGYNGTNWIRLRGVYDEDEDTFITAELTPGANDGVIRFYANGNLIADIDETRFSTDVIDVGDIKIYNNVIETVNPGQDLLINAANNGSIVIDDFAFNQNTITNRRVDAVTQFLQEGQGYFKLDTNRAFIVPVGTSLQRPSAAVLGMMRFNRDLLQIEIFDGVQWVSVAGAQGAINAATAQDIAIEVALMLG